MRALALERAVEGQRIRVSHLQLFRDAGAEASVELGEPPLITGLAPHIDVMLRARVIGDVDLHGHDQRCASLGLCRLLRTPRGPRAERKTETAARREVNLQMRQRVGNGEPEVLCRVRKPLPAETRDVPNLESTRRRVERAR